MKKQVRAAELKRYNANSRGTNTGDCVKRSISLAFSISYNEAGKLLNAKMHELHRNEWNIPQVFFPVIQELGGSDKIFVKDLKLTVGQFADSVAEPDKNYIIASGKTLGRTTHMVCIRDNVIYDSWDCRDYYVTWYSIINAASVRPIQDRNPHDFSDIAIEAEKAVEAEINKYADKHDIKIDFTDVEGLGHDYKIKVSCLIILDKDNISEKKRKYTFDILIVVEPTLPNDELEEFVLKTAKQRAYDRMWSVNEQEKKLKEAKEIADAAGLADVNGYKYYLTPQEEKFVNSLPGWVKPLITFVDIQRPNYYSDSYQIKLNLLPDDDLHPDLTEYVFEGFNASEIREQLDIYKKKHELMGIDYYRDDIF